MDTSSKTCFYCGQMLNNTIGFHEPLCTNPGCRSRIFVIGNRVILRKQSSIGIGIIQDKINFGDEEFVLSSHKSSKNSKKKTQPNPLLHTKFLVEFSIYLEKPVYLDELNHYIWVPGSKIRFKINQIIQTGIVHEYLLFHSSGLIHYIINDDDGNQHEIDETQIVESINNPLEEFFKGRLEYQNKFLLRLWGFQILDLYSSSELKIVTNSRLSLLPHQIGVAHHLLNIGNARYILADEVGLGKTIEAGIFIKEMIARKLASRVLIITPASITSQWEFELKNKFNLEFIRLKSKLVKNLVVNPQSGNFRVKDSGQEISLCICTLQYARLTQCQKVLPQIEWDIVIFDEAHHLRRYLANQKTELYRSTLAYDLAQKLAEKTKSLLLLTATPIQLHSFDLYSLIELLNPYEFPTYESFEVARKQIPFLNVVVNNLRNFTRINIFEREALVDQILSFNVKSSASQLSEKLKFQPRRHELIKFLENQHFLSRYVIRNRRRVVFPNNPVHRIPQIIEVDLTPDETVLYEKIHQYLARIYSQNFDSGPSGLGFVMVILQKLLTSSSAAFLKSLRKRIKYLEENKEMILKLGEDQPELQEFTDEDNSLDYAWGLDEMDIEDRMVVKKRNQAMKPKKEAQLNINDHITILKEFEKEMSGLSFDSKAMALMDLIEKVLKNNPNDKIIIFTQFKETLFYLHRLLKKNGYKITEFHGDLSESQKNTAVSNFRRDITIMLSTEIGGEGRNFQFCHIIVNYDLPWNPMRLEQRIGRLDRFGQTDNILIFNFYIKNTVESSIVTAIDERIHLFEESIGALEPILGSLEKQITDLVLKEDGVPMKFRLDEVIQETGNKIEEVYNKLEDLILDKRSFQYDFISKELDKSNLLTGIDLFSFIKYFKKIMSNKQQFKDPDLIFKMSLIQDSQIYGIYTIELSEKLRTLLKLPEQNFSGTFDLDVAKEQEEYDFFALGHSLIMNIAEFTTKDLFGGFSTRLYLDGKKTGQLFLPPYGTRLTGPEIEIFQRLLKQNEAFNLFIFEIEFLGIIVEKVIVPIFITDSSEFLPSLTEYIWRPHNLQKIIFPVSENYGNSEKSSFTRENLEQCYLNARSYTKDWIEGRINVLIESNKQKYFQKKAQIMKTAKLKQSYAESQLKKVKELIRLKKLKLPTERQKENLEKIDNPDRKKRKMKEYEKLEENYQYYVSEERRWQEILNNIDFDIPEQIKRLKKYRQISVNANFIGYARTVFK